MRADLNRLTQYFGAVLLLSVPFYVWTVFWPVGGLPFGLPISFLMIMFPSMVASYLAFRDGGPAGLQQLWSQLVNIASLRKWWWLMISLGTMPASMLLAYFAMLGLGLPLPQVPQIPWADAPVMFLVYACGAVIEEVGWTGYATPKLLSRYGVLGTGIIIGVVWAGWHVIPWLSQGHGLAWVGGEVALTILMRVIMVRIYADGGRSLIMAVLFHAMINTSYSLFPNAGSHYDPTASAVALLCLAAGYILIDGLHTAVRARSTR